jgi:hypothetical protein
MLRRNFASIAADEGYSDATVDRWQLGSLGPCEGMARLSGLASGSRRPKRRGEPGWDVVPPRRG